MEFFVLNFQKFMLVFVRIAGLVFVEPIFGSQTVPGSLKLGLSFFASAVIFPLAYPFLGEIPSDIVAYALMAATQAFIGAAIGFCITLSFGIYMLAGQFFTVQMGFGASEVFDPMSEISIPIIGQYIYIIGILVFLSLNGPIFVLKELFLSFELLNADNIFNINLLSSKYGLVYFFVNMFSIALRIALPIAGTLLLVSFTMGLLAKAAPQMDLLMIGFPVSIIVGYLIVLIVLPLMIEFFSDFIDDIFKNIWNLMLELKNG
ncbi:MAG: flagellar biosynthetic protein FliR [Spirochaetes bacterium]|nr:flagellar biosynthetic protein FliR [Spirochaetota bacterium]